VDTNLSDVRKHVALLSDEALLEVNREDLTEAAQGIYEEEVARRGLAWPVEEEPEAAGPISVGGNLVSVSKYDTLEDARFARDLLRNEGIPAWFAGELALKKSDSDPLAGLELLTQADYLEQAQMLLSAEISEEELARQAEEAGALAEVDEEVEEEEP
jgi:hypothetical protein